MLTWAFFMERLAYSTQEKPLCVFHDSFRGEKQKDVMQNEMEN